MAHTLDTSAYTDDSAANPVTLSYTCAAGATALAVAIMTAGGTRAGTAPTYNGVTMTELGVSPQSSTENDVEMWYLIGPSTGSAYNISVPNTGTEYISIHAASFIAGVGKTSSIHVGTGDSDLSSSNPSAGIITTEDG